MQMSGTVIIKGTPCAWHVPSINLHMMYPGLTADGATSGQVYDDDDDDDDGVFVLERIVELPSIYAIVLPIGKRRREGVEASNKRHRGEQRGLCQLNLDELHVIFTYIYPMDLLNLARTCKSLRSILMRKSSLFIWKTALRQIEGLPDCPADLSEPEYTNLVFYARCHSCGKLAKTVLWNIRRRYCPDCRVQRLCDLRFCNGIIRGGWVLPADWFNIMGKGWQQWVDNEQMNSFMREYYQSSDKTQFLVEKRKQCQIIYLHATRCGSWQHRMGRMQRFDLEVLRKERRTSIFERLEQHGYGPEIEHFGDGPIVKSYKSVFKDFNPVTSGEWDQMWPEWVKIMNDFRLRRMNETLWLLRRRSLALAYRRFITHPAPDTPTLDIVPHLVDVADFPPFRDIIMAPEDARLDDEPFAFAFAQLPVLVDEWVQKFCSEIAGLMKIPSCLSLDAASTNRDGTSSSSGRAKLFRTDLDRLQLACAVFHVGSSGPLAFPEILFATGTSSCGKPGRNAVCAIAKWMLDGMGWSGSIDERFGLEFLEEAPYIVHACGLDPNVATMDDMDHRNARLKCLSCRSRILIMSWRHAIWHARSCHYDNAGLAPLSESPRWQHISDECVGVVHAVEWSVQTPNLAQCMLCRPCVGGALSYACVARHFAQCHDMEAADVKEGVQYRVLGIRGACAVEMAQVGCQAVLRAVEEA